MPNSQLDLKVWGGAWDLPSLDPVCLSAITYACFSSAPINVLDTIPSQTVTGNLPELEVDDEMIYSDLFSIIGIFRREGYNADYNLSANEQADTLAFLSYIERNLKPAILFALWMDSNNYLKVTRPAYSKLFGFPRSYYSPGKLKEKVEDFIKNCGSFEKKSILDIEKILYKQAKDCLDVLEKQLGKRKYFFDDRPTTIDAACYGHLAILLKAPLLSTEVKNHLFSCEKLKAHCHRIEQHFVKESVAGTSSGGEAVKKSASKTSTSSSKDAVAVGILPGKDMVLTFGIGASLMMLFAYSQGIFTSKRSLLAHQLGAFKN